MINNKLHTTMVWENTKKLVFYNHHQNGDLALSRGIVNWIINNCSEKIDFYFSINLDRIKYYDAVYFNEKVTTVGERDNAFDEKCVYLNLWIGSSPSFRNRSNSIKNEWGDPVDYTSDNILKHCIELIDTLKNNKNIDIPYPKTEEDILPRANFKPKQKKNVDDFLEKIKDFDKKVLICNGDVHSLQCPNFYFTNVIKGLVKDFPNIAFIYTNKDRDLDKNEFCINDYCEIPNLNEIDYLSTQCDVLVTRRSGPGEIIQTYENFFDPTKTFISFTTYKEASFVFKNGKATLDWTNDFSDTSIVNIIKKHIE